MRLGRIASKNFPKARHSSGKSVVFSCFGSIDAQFLQSMLALFFELTQADSWKCIKKGRMKNGTHFCVFSSMKRCDGKSSLYKKRKITCINLFSTSDCHYLLLFCSNQVRSRKNAFFGFIYDFHSPFWRFLRFPWYLQWFELFMI